MTGSGRVTPGQADARTPMAPARLPGARVLFVADVVVDVYVVLAGPGPGVIVPHSVQHEVAELARVGVLQPDGPGHRGFEHRVVVLVDHVAVAAPGWRAEWSRSTTVSAGPPLARTTGTVPYFSAISWLSPHGSNKPGITRRSAPA